MSDGTIEEADGRVTFRYMRHLRHPVDVVWKTITDPDEIEQWIGSRPEIDLREGGEYVSYHGGTDRVVDRVIRVEAPRLFVHTFWMHINPSAVVTWELTDADGGTQLVLTHALDSEDVRNGAQTFGVDSAFILSRNGAGWHMLLDKLGTVLDGHPEDCTEAEQQALRDRYAGLLPRS